MNTPRLVFALLAALVTTCLSQSLEIPHRQLHQRTSTVVIDDSNAENFVRLVEDAERGSTVELRAAEVPLESLLQLRRRGVTLLGVNARPTQLLCSADGRIEISATDVAMVNLRIDGCRDGAVGISNDASVFDPFDVDAVYDFAPNEVNFTQVEFRNNAVDPNARRNAGGALNVGPGTKAVMETCLFRGNSASVGGAVAVDGAGSLEVRNGVFEENEATIAGGAIAAGLTTNFFDTQESIVIRRCEFRRNRDTSGGEDASGLTLPNGAPLENSVFLRFPSPTPSGGAIYVQGYSSVVIDRSSFVQNSAVPAGGAIFVSDNERVTLKRCDFEGNEVTSVEGETDRLPDLELGGAVYLAFTDVASRATIDRCTFTNNTAAYGGAFHAVTELSTELIFDNCQIEDNTAELAGGAILIRNTIQARFRNVRFNRNKATAGGGLMLTNGAGAGFFDGPGAVTNDGTFDPDALDVYFTENEALDGGGVFLLGAGQVLLQNARFNRNRAQRNGGGVCVISSLPSGLTSLQGSFFHSNAARRGGALFADGVANFQVASVSGVPTEFTKNKALAGGAMLIRPTSQVTNLIGIREARFKENEAVVTEREAEIHNLDLPDVQVETTALGRRLVFLRTLSQSRPSSASKGPPLLDSEAEDACLPGGGGALCLLSGSVPERAPVEIIMEGVRMVENRARVGGGIFAATSREDDWVQQCDSTGSAFESLTSKPCKSFSIAQPQFRSNKATSAGGGLFVSHPESVFVDAAGDGSYTRLSEVSLTAAFFEDNRVQDDAFGANIASNAASLRITKPIVPENDLLIAGHNSGEELPRMRLEVLDVYGQVVAGGVKDSAMSVSIESEVVSGQRVASADRGKVLFSRVVALGEPIEYTMIFRPDSSTAQSLSARFSIRQCIVGETRIDEKNVCDVCDQEFFGFNYEFPCDGCPDNARCDGAAVLTPVSGYWHSTPYSPIMHECILEEACSYNGRRASLREFYSDPGSLTPTNETVSEKVYPQCADEYEGPLCGSCVKGYGHVIDGECVECRDVWLTAVLICIVCVWTLFLLVSTARGAFDTIRDMHDMRLKRVLTHNTSRGGGLRQTPLGSQRSTQSSDSSHRKTTKKTTSFQEEDDVEASDGSEQQNKAMRGQTSLSNRYASVSGDSNVDHIMAAEKVSETIKILTNFLQITSVGVGINASWTQSIRFLLVVEDSVASVSSGASFAPMECLFKNLEDRTVIGIVLRVVFPLALTLIYVVFNALKHHKDRANMKRRVIIGFIVGIFFAYDTVTEMLMRLVNCVTLDNPNPEDPEAPFIIQHYSIYATAVDEYWAEDTKHVCWEGAHGIAAGILGVPGLVIISFGIPFGLAMFLLYKRYRGVVLEPECLNTYGFVYQSYQAGYVFWESIIMLRKASMAAVIVYAYDLGPNLQSAIALGILIFSLLAQFLAQPYKYKSLNILESLSLLASIFIFYSGVVFRDPNTSYAGKVVLSVIIITTNILIIGLFLYRLFVTYDNLIVAKLRVEKVEVIPEKAIDRVKLLSKINATKIKDSIQEKLQKKKSDKNNAVEEEPAPDPTSGHDTSP